MYFSDISSFIAMGGHGTFVWSAYGVAFLVIIYNIMAPVLARKKLAVQLQRQEKIQARQRRVTRATVSSADIQTDRNKIVEGRG